MRASPRFALVVLLALSALVAAGLYFNARHSPTETMVPSAPLPEGGKVPEVDQGTLQTARELSALAAGPEERQLAQNAERVADHEVDLALTAP